MTEDVERFLDELYEKDRKSHSLVNQAILVLERNGPGEGRPLVDTVVGTSVANLKELRPGSSAGGEVRVLFAFDPWRSAILLIAGDKSGRWRSWYRWAVPRAELLYGDYLSERREADEA
ncbi:type II toxin-antitoxin system RelE/ParE family toxin [Nocardiopsis alba]|uniref:type II toxin-antitoxin system RelE/ParE family toxin n=1 Tax=Nocardiopsis alba TaxID=53437 RepID=UPI00366B39E7